MLRTLLESALIELSESKEDIKSWIDYTYNSMNKNHLTDIEKEIKESGINKEELEVIIMDIINDDDFREELKDLDIEIIYEI